MRKPLRVDHARLERVSLLAVVGLFVGMLLSAILEMAGVHPSFALLVPAPVLALVCLLLMFSEGSTDSHYQYAALVLLSLTHVGVYAVTIATGNGSVIAGVLMCALTALGTWSFLSASMPAD